MNAYLALYIDTDYIVPIVDTDNGNLQKYASAEEGARFWLYFYDSPHKSGVDYGRSFKANYESGLPGYIGNFWQLVEDEAVYNNGIAQVPYCHLLQHSGILDGLRRFYDEAAGHLSSIPFVCIFSETISLKARSRFISFMQESGFELWSYSVDMNTLAIERVLQTHRSLHPQFGDKMLLFHSSGRDLLFSFLTYDGTAFLLSEKPVCLKDSGDAPVKKALVEFVVNKVDEHLGFLTAESRPREYGYQMQFADEWLQRSKGRQTFNIDDYHYSSDPSVTYSCKVDCAYLRSVQENAIRHLLLSMENFKNRVVKNDLLHVILLGDAFADDLFREKVIDTIGDARMVTYLPDLEIQEALHLYNDRYKSLREQPEQMEKQYRRYAEQAEAIGAWISSAEKLRTLRIDLQETLQNFRVELEKAKKSYLDIVSRWLEAMQQHQFDKAQELIEAELPNQGNLQALQVRAAELNARSESCTDIYTKVSRFQGAAKLLGEIDSLLHEVMSLYTECEELLADRTQKYEQVAFFRACYPEYRQKMAQLKKEGNYTLRQRIIEELKGLSLAPVPVIDVEEIEIRLRAEVETTGGFFRKKKHLKVKVQILDGAKLPCRCVLLIASKNMVRILRDEAFTEDFDAGMEGVWEHSYELPLMHCEKAQNLYIYFWPHEDEMVPINSFVVNRCSVKL